MTLPTVPEDFLKRLEQALEKLKEEGEKDKLNLDEFKILLTTVTGDADIMGVVKAWVSAVFPSRILGSFFLATDGTVALPRRPGIDSTPVPRGTKRDGMAPQILVEKLEADVAQFVKEKGHEFAVGAIAELHRRQLELLDAQLRGTWWVALGNVEAAAYHFEPDDDDGPLGAGGAGGDGGVGEIPKNAPVGEATGRWEKLREVIARRNSVQPRSMVQNTKQNSFGGSDGEEREEKPPDQAEVLNDQVAGGGGGLQGRIPLFVGRSRRECMLYVAATNPPGLEIVFEDVFFEPEVLRQSNDRAEKHWARREASMAAASAEELSLPDSNPFAINTNQDANRRRSNRRQRKRLREFALARGWVWSSALE